MKRKPNPVPAIDLIEVAKNSKAVEEFAGQPAFSGAEEGSTKLAKRSLSLPLAAMLLF